MISKKLVLLTIVLNCVIVMSAQSSKITSFYGVKFGDSRSAIETGVKSQGKTGEWRRDNSKKIDYYLVSNPKLGSITFNLAKFYVTDGLLSTARFINFYEVSDHGEDSVFLENVEQDRNLSQSRSQEKFEQMREELVSKYGNPSVDSNDRCVWKSGNNTIILQYRSYTRYEEFSAFGNTSRWPVYCYEVSVEYSSSKNKSIDNF